MRPALRLLPLPLCIAFSLNAQAGDDMPLNWGLCPVQDVVKPFAEAQAAPEGVGIANTEQATDIEGDALSGTEENPVFNGNVTLRRGNQFMGADQLTYDKGKEHYDAQGSIRYQGSGLRMTAASAEGDQAKDTHVIRDLDYQLLSHRGNGGADSVTLTGNHGVLHGATYSTCPPDARHWELRAHRIDIDTESGMAVARGATLKVGKVPVIYLPWFMFPTDERRRTGLLFPSVSNSSRNGLDWKQPIYLNLAPNYDATLNPRLIKGLLNQYPLIYLQSREEQRLERQLAELSRAHFGDDRPIEVWSAALGLHGDLAQADPLEVIQTIRRWAACGWESGTTSHAGSGRPSKPAHRQ